MAKNHKQVKTKQILIAVGALLLVAILVTVLTRYRTKPQISSAATSTYSDYFGIAGIQPSSSGNVSMLEWRTRLGIQDPKRLNVRASVSWSAMQPCAKTATNSWQDCMDNALTNNFNGTAQASKDGKIRILAMLAYAPTWALDPACVSAQGGNTWDPAEQRPKPAPRDLPLNANPARCIPRNPQVFGQFVGKMAAKYKSYDMHDWEIWNEPNSFGFFRNKDNLTDPDFYAEMVKAAYTAVKKGSNPVDPQANIVMGATSAAGKYTPTSTAALMEPRAFIQQAFQHAEDQNWHLKDYFDTLSHHPYFWSGGSANLDTKVSWYMMYRNAWEQDTNDNGVIDKITYDIPCPASINDLKAWPKALNNAKKPSLRCLMQVYGATGKKIWNSESGSPSVTLRHQKRDNNNNLMFDQNGHPIWVDDPHTQDSQVTDINNAVAKWKTYIAAGWAENFFYFTPKDWDGSSLLDGVWAESNWPARTGLTTVTAPDPTCGSDGHSPGGSAKKAFCVYKQLLASPTSGARPSVNLTANPDDISAGASSTLSWTVTGADSCTASGGAWTGAKNSTSGSSSVSPTGTTTYTLTCTNDNGQTSDSVTVTVNSANPPTVNLTRSPASIAAGAASTLNWTTTNATTCTASGAWSGAKTTTGNTTVRPITNATYTLSCTGSGGSSSDSVTVTVTPSNIPGDIANPPNGDGRVNLYDFVYLLSKWGTNDTRADLSGPTGSPDRTVNHADISKWSILNIQANP